MQNLPRGIPRKTVSLHDLLQRRGRQVAHARERFLHSIEDSTDTHGFLPTGL